MTPTRGYWYRCTGECVSSDVDAQTGTNDAHIHTASKYFRKTHTNTKETKTMFVLSREKHCNATCYDRVCPVWGQTASAKRCCCCVTSPSQRLATRRSKRPFAFRYFPNPRSQFWRMFPVEKLTRYTADWSALSWTVQARNVRSTFAPVPGQCLRRAVLALFNNTTVRTFI